MPALNMQKGKGPTKVEANYRQAEDEKACAACSNFISPNKCRVLRNEEVDPGGTCDFYNPARDRSAIEQELFGPGGGPDAATVLSQLGGGAGGGLV